MRPAARVGLALAALLSSPLNGTATGVKVVPPPPAPALELHQRDGSALSLSDLGGKVVVVDFWASWCAPCQRSFPALDTLYRERHGDGLEVLAVNVDEDRRPAEKFLSSRPHAMPVFLDPGGVAPRAFRVEAMPSTYVLDRQGRIRFKHAGFTDADAAALAREVDGLLSEEVVPATR